MMSRFLICGADGMLANAILTNEYFNDNTAYGRQVFNLCDTEQMREVIRRDKPEYVINCAAFTDVTKADRIIRLLTALMHWEQRIFVNYRKNWFCINTFSTDFVFKGDLNRIKEKMID
jgi:dTDP-4-dehydrorhamnose reductase